MSVAKRKPVSFIQSHQFTFSVGLEGRSIVVHAAAIAATSPRLDALIHGGMTESETPRATIKDVQVDDFIRFCEYAYCGDYTVPAWEELPLEPSSKSGLNQQNGDDDDWDWAAPSTKKKKKCKKSIWEEPAETRPDPEPALDPELQYEVKPISRTPLRTHFNNRQYMHNGGSKALALQRFEPKTNSAANQNFTPVLLAHARLYCFAHVRLIEPLKALTLDKLHKTLTGFKLYTQRVEDIIELARYAYSNSDLPGRMADGTLGDLRQLVVEYIVCEVDTIGKSNEFVKYMEEGGEFVGDFWRMARTYMN
jgi:hypothetical protein